MHYKPPPTPENQYSHPLPSIDNQTFSCAFYLLIPLNVAFLKALEEFLGNKEIHNLFSTSFSTSTFTNS